MNSLTPDDWLARVRAAQSGPELLDFLKARFIRPYEVGPTLDDRHGEGPEEVFEEIAREDDAFRQLLEDALAVFFKDPATLPSDVTIHPVIRGFLEMTARLALTGVFTPLRAWLQRNEGLLRIEKSGVLGRATLSALATAQPRGLKDVRDFWLRWWEKGPIEWQTRAFVGLRLQDPKVAASEIPELMQRAREQKQDPGALLRGMWNQPDGRLALVEWLRQNEDDVWTDDVRQALLRQGLSPSEQSQLGKPKMKRLLPSLAAPDYSLHAAPDYSLGN